MGQSFIDATSEAETVCASHFTFACDKDLRQPYIFGCEQPDEVAAFAKRMRRLVKEKAVCMTKNALLQIPGTDNSNSIIQVIDAIRLGCYGDEVKAVWSLSSVFAMLAGDATTCAPALYLNDADAWVSYPDDYELRMILREIDKFVIVPITFIED